MSAGVLSPPQILDHFPNVLAVRYVRANPLLKKSIYFSKIF
jgi:hypothetical protein